MTCRQTTCRYCGRDIENTSPYRAGEWRDRGNNRACGEGVYVTRHTRHAPIRERDLWPLAVKRARGNRAGQRFVGPL